LLHISKRAAAAALFVFCGAPCAQPPGFSQPEPASGDRGELRAAIARHDMVAAAHPLATEAGLEILRAGGSSVDAAVAVQLVLGLVEPQSSGIGGGAFLLHWSEKERRVRSYDGRETAPAAAHEDRFLDAQGRPLEFMRAVASGRSVGVPGVLRMLELAHRRHGKLPWAQLFAPAIRLAEGGFPISPRLHGLLERDKLLRLDAGASRLWYLEDGSAKPVGTKLVNAEYAALLREIAERGADAFYKGEIAGDIVRAVRAHEGGDMTLDDLARYAAKEREPLCGAYRSYRICGMGPPSAGVVSVLQILGMLERTGFARAAPESADALHLFIEAARLAYADRTRFIADPDFIRVPVQGLLAADYLDRRARLIGERALRDAPAGEPAGAPAVALVPDTERHGTSHFSIVDASGDAVAMTSTIENAFGSRILVRGFLLNNELTDFSFVPSARGLPAANRVEAGKRPRSSMSPTFVFSPDGALRMALGSPGGPLIVDYVAKTLIGTLDWRLDAQAAISLPNFAGIENSALIERGSRDASLLGDALASRGHALRFVPLTSGVQAIERVPNGWRGAVDPRREGVARGE
jgi:gamma-glutamyltranspeptidase/glutathione hydrolase